MAFLLKIDILDKFQTFKKTDCLLKNLHNKKMIKTNSKKNIDFFFN